MKAFTRRFAGVALAAALVIPLAACGTSSPQGTQTGGEVDTSARFRYGGAAIPASLDPRTSSPYDGAWTGLLYESLIKRAPDGTFHPGLATEWKAAPDLLSLDFTLRPNLKFTDGAPVNAAAVKANIEWAQKHTTNFSNFIANVSAVEVIDDTHVRLRFTDSGAPMLGVFAGEAGMLISPAALDRTDLSKVSFGAGPFKLDKFEGANMSFSKSDSYWNKDSVKLAGVDVTVYIDEAARLRALRSGQLDYTNIQPKQVAESKAAGLQIVTGDIADFWGVILNTGRSEFGNPKVRQAMLLAVDRKSIADNIFPDSCVPSAQPFSPGDWALPPDLDKSPAAQFNVARAKQLMAEAGLPNGFTFELQTGTAQTNMQLSQVLQSQWKEIGINVVVKPMENVQFVTARRQGNFDATVSVYQSGRPDESVVVQNFYLPGGLFNPGKYTLPGVAELLKQSSSTLDPAGRAQPMHKIMTDALADGPPLIPICTRTGLWATGPKVRGVKASLQFDPILQDVWLAK
ncbi:ABC transporter substrate-binding protein [Amycolatopsis pigmentata]|uniref:ABC transporter substrate-binding protein n=1 Tax=Amycolatopsis pigmentata TaxID=450801 RepID=A0ABW5G279_9PSEU